MVEQTEAVIVVYKTADFNFQGPMAMLGIGFVVAVRHACEMRFGPVDFAARGDLGEGMSGAGSFPCNYVGTNQMPSLYRNPPLRLILFSN